MSNKSEGNRFEREFCQMLGENGFWAHNMIASEAGQPADIIAVRGHVHCLIDCKVVSTDDGFPFTRIEENQRLAMDTFSRKGASAPCYFALKLPDESIRIALYWILQRLEESGMKVLKGDDLYNYTVPFELWVSTCK